MFLDGLVAADELHISDLTLAGVKKHTVFGPAVPIAVLFAALTREEEDVWGVAGRRNATLALTAEGIMDIPLSIVDLPDFKHVATFAWGLVT